MNSIQLSNALLRTIFILIGIALGLYFIYLISSIVIYIICAFLLSFIAEPFFRFFKNKLKLNATVAVSISLTLLICLIIGISMLFVPLLLKQSQKLALLDLNALQKNYYLFITHLENWLVSHHINYKASIDHHKITESLNFNFITELINSMLSALGNFGLALFSIFFIAFFLMKDQQSVALSIKYLIPKKHKRRILISILKIKNMLAKYTIGLCIQLFFVFIMYLIVLLLFHVENAFIIALLGAILNIIPYVGPLIAALMTAFLTALSTINQDFNTVIMPTTLNVLIGYGIVQLIDNNFSQPIITSKSTNSHPLEVFIIISVAGTTMGITGMIIAIPLYTSLKIILKEFFPENKFIHVLTRNL